MTQAQSVCFDPNLTFMWHHQEQHRRYLSAALLVVGFPVRRRAPMAYTQVLAT
jgi:hypothetical protein